MAGEKVRGAYPRQWFGRRVRGEAEPAQRISDEEAWVRGVRLDSLQGAQCRTPVSRADAHRREPLAGAARDGQVHRPTRRRDRSEQRAGVHSKHGCRHGGVRREPRCVDFANKAGLATSPGRRSGLPTPPSTVRRRDSPHASGLVNCMGPLPSQRRQQRETLTIDIDSLSCPHASGIFTPGLTACLEDSCVTPAGR